MSPGRQKDESPGGQAEASGVTCNEGGHGIVSAQAEAAQPAREKRIATLAARLALRGISLHRLDSGALLIVQSRGALMRELADLDAVEGLLARMEGRP